MQSREAGLRGEQAAAEWHRLDEVNAVARSIFTAPYCTAVVGKLDTPLSFAAFDD